MYKTPFGLRLRATEKTRERLMRQGENVIALRYVAVVLSGVLAAAGGAYLFNWQSSLFTRGMTAGTRIHRARGLDPRKMEAVPVLFACAVLRFYRSTLNPNAGRYQAPVR